MRIRVGIDIGGTSVKAGRLDAANEAYSAPGMATELQRGAGPFLDALAAMIRELGAEDSVGIGVPGVFEPGTRLLAGNTNLPELVQVDLCREVAQRLGWDATQVFVENDANAAALGEARLGAGRGKGDMVMVTLGTGVGGGIVVDGKVMRGSRGQGAEVGHLKIHDRENCKVPCGCGRWGCLESFASATAAMRRASELDLDTDLATLTNLSRAQDGAERQLLHAIGHDLGIGLAQILVLLDVPTIVVGGGFGAALDQLLPGIYGGIAEQDCVSRKLEILPARLGASAGWIGAALLAESSPKD